MQEELTLTEIENNIIRDTFLDNLALLKAMRRIAFGLEVTDQEKNTIKTAFANDELCEAIRKRLKPELGDDDNLAFIGYDWAGTETLISNQTPDTITQVIAYKKVRQDLTAQALALFKDPFSGKIELNMKPSQTDKMQSELLGEIQYVRHIQSQLNFLNVVAEQNRLSPIQKEDMAKKDSTE